MFQNYLPDSTYPQPSPFYFPFIENSSEVVVCLQLKNLKTVFYPHQYTKAILFKVNNNLQIAKNLGQLLVFVLLDLLLIFDTVDH